MGTVSEKLVYLNGTKQAIKQAINEDFEVIDNNTTFREYAEEISSNNAKYKDLIPKETKNATNTLDISNSAGLDKALVTQYGNTSQKTTTGKNLLPNNQTTQTINGLTFTMNSDKSVTITGTATTNTDYYFVGTTTQYVDFGLTTGTYNLNGCTGGSEQTYMLFAVMNRNGKIYYYNSTYAGGRNMIVETGDKFRIFIRVISGTNVNTTIYPQLEVGNTATAYEPYTNGASPNPDYPQEIHVISGDNSIKVEGKNLFDNSVERKNAYPNITFSSIGQPVEYNNSSATYSYVNSAHLKAGQEYTISWAQSTTPVSVNERIGVIVDENNIVLQTQITWINSTDTIKFTSNYNGYLILATDINATNIQIEKGSTATTYEPYQEQSFDLDLPSGIELCKIGDYKDRIYSLNGKWYLEKKIGKLVLDGSENWIQDRELTNSFRYYTGQILPSAVEGVGISDNFINVTMSALNNTDKEGICRLYEKQVGIRLNKSRATSVKTFKNWLSNNNTILYYALLTPTTEEITESNYPTLYNQLNNIKLFEGVNHITMTNESGLDVEFDITYYKDWKLD